MESKAGKTLKNLLYTASIITLGTFLPMKSANGQITKTQNITMKEAEKEMDRAQKIYFEGSNTLYLTLQPVDMGVGLRYDKKIGKFNRFGLYTSFSKGNYEFGDGIYIRNHTKTSFGGLIYLNKDFDGYRGFLSGGLSYHTYGERNYNPEFINEKKLNSFSGEFGGGVVMSRFTGSLNFDLKLDVSLNLGINF